MRLANTVLVYQPDTVVYLSAAQSLLKGEGLVTYTGVPLVEFPPLYPILIALALPVYGGPSMEALRLIAILSSALISGLSLHLALRYLSSFQMRVYAMLLILFGVPLWAVIVLGRSEAPFIALTLLWFLMVERYLSTPIMRYLILMPLLALLCLLTRYVGVALVVLGG